MTRPPDERDLMASVEAGLLKVVGKNADGETLFALTEDGEARVEELLDQVIEHAAAVYAAQVGVPLYVARDLILHRASELGGAE